MELASVPRENSSAAYYKSFGGPGLSGFVRIWDNLRGEYESPEHVDDLDRICTFQGPVTGVEPAEETAAIPAEPTPFLDVSIEASFVGPASLPLNERATNVGLHASITGSQSVDSVRATLPDGSSVLLPRITPENFGVGVAGWPELPGQYIFTGLDADEQPISGLETSVTRVGKFPPDPPVGVAASITALGLIVTWDPVDPVPLTFEPDQGIGRYTVVVGGTDRPGLIYENLTPVLIHNIPIARAGAELNSYSLPIEEWADGVYTLWVSAEAQEWDGEHGRTINVSMDPAEILLITVEGGKVIDIQNATATNTVTFPDVNLGATIRGVLGKPASQEISPAELAGITELTADRRGIVDITGIENLVNLTVLNLDGNPIVDFSRLASLGSLTNLVAGPDVMAGIPRMTSLTSLTIISEAGNEIIDISGLASLENLAELYLNENQIVDISPLASLTSLRIIDLAGNEISDITPLGSLTNLEALFLHINQMSDISPLASLTSLTQINFHLWPRPESLRLWREPSNATLDSGLRRKDRRWDDGLGIKPFARHWTSVQ